MKICAIICEYNPFHNGHLYQIEAVKRTTDSDSVVCFMSGNFVQRGEAAILGKYVRAKHAILAGADAVIELPAVFSTSTAEIFAKGAVKLLASVPAVKTLCFGCESGNAEAFRSAAQKLKTEPAEISEKIKNLLSLGASYARARAEAWQNDIPPELLLRPNNILGLEYTRALSALNADIRIFPLRRAGSDYAETRLQGHFSSAASIREALVKDSRENLSEALPPYVLRDIPSEFQDNAGLLEKFALLERTADEIRRVCDCTEGLENALKRAATENVSDIVREITSRRYTASRIRRIMLQNLLNISETFIRECLGSPLYLRILAVRRERKEILPALSESPFPLLIRAGDEEKLHGTAEACYEKERFADRFFSLIRGTSAEKKNIFIEE